MDTERGRLFIKQAFIWLDEGFPIVPCLHRSKECHLHWRAFEKKLPSGDQVRRWFMEGEKNMAVICGTSPAGDAGGLLVLDFDALDQWSAFQASAGHLAETYCEMSGRGVHAFYKVDRPQSRKFDQCEALGLGHLCLVYPSIHPSGRPYQVMSDSLSPILEVTTDKLFSFLSNSSSTAGQLRKAEDSIPTPNPGLESKGLITRLKTLYPLFAYASNLTKLTRSNVNGRWWVGRCPLHEDKQPSFWLDAERQIWGCYSSSCRGHQGGDVINLYALVNNMTVKEAVRQLAMGAEWKQ